MTERLLTGDLVIVTKEWGRETALWCFPDFNSEWHDMVVNNCKMGLCLAFHREGIFSSLRVLVLDAATSRAGWCSAEMLQLEHRVT